MSEKRRTAPESEGLRRRDVLRLGAGLVTVLAWPVRSAAAALSPELAALLDRSGFVYVSPLKSDGSESRCHGEVWFGWHDDAVVLITARTSWKGRALARGLSRARVWVGDHGRAGRILGSGEAFRAAPSFDARVEESKDPALLERLMATYRRKYPKEIESWEGRMRSGFESGERMLIRYTPV